MELLRLTGKAGATIGLVTAILALLIDMYVYGIGQNWALQYGLIALSMERLWDGV